MSKLALLLTITFFAAGALSGTSVYQQLAICNYEDGVEMAILYSPENATNGLLVTRNEDSYFATDATIKFSADKKSVSIDSVVLETTINQGKTKVPSPAGTWDCNAKW